MELFSLTDIKKKNLADIYHYIYNNHGCSKQIIASSLNISLPTVTQHLITLLNEGLISKCGQLSSTVGRRATAYCAVPTARIAIGIEILPHCIYVVALNLYGKKEAKEKYKLNFCTEQSYFEELKNIVFDFLHTHEYDEKQILGIGLGIQGLTSRDGREIVHGLILNCSGLSIEMFSKYFSVPCRFIHDAECAANSELWENPEVQDAIYISLGYHLGGAIIINRELQTGLTGKTGIFEHMTLIPDGRTCYCGRKGCAECYCSGNSLLEKDMQLEDFFLQKQNHDTAAQKKWHEYLMYLSRLIYNLHTVIDSTVILGGHIAAYFTEDDIAYIRNSVQKWSAFQDQTTYILSGRCRVDAVSTGSALPFIKDFLDKFAFQELTAN